MNTQNNLYVVMVALQNIWMNEGVAAEAVTLVAVCEYVNLNLITK